MKFLIDAQLPYGLKLILAGFNVDAIHTDDLLDKELTTDNQIRKISVDEDRIVISKDSDFFDSYFVKKVPKKLLMITTGNVRNKDLFEMFKNNFHLILEGFNTNDLIEMDNNDLYFHE